MVPAEADCSPTAITLLVSAVEVSCTTACNETKTAPCVLTIAESRRRAEGRAGKNFK